MAELRRLIERHRTPIGVLVVLALIALGFAALQHLTQEIRFADVRSALHDLSGTKIALALLATAGSYLALTFYDLLALHTIGRPLPWRTAALASFTSYTLSHNLGLALLTGGSARYRIYSAAGLDGPDVARVVAIASGTFWAGVVSVTGVALLLHPGALDLAGLRLSAGEVQFAGWAIAALTVALLGACAVVRAPIRLFAFTLPLPSPGLLLLQIAIALVDIACASAALFVLIPGAAPALLPAFILAYTLGIVAAVVTHVPGGIGVFEAVVLAVVPVDRATLFAALIAYRVLYYLLPLGFGVLVLAWHEGARQRRRSVRFLSGVRAVATGVAPLALSVATFMAGAMLLLSGSLPSVRARMGDLAAILPLPMIEFSSIAASLTGTALLLLAPALYRRLDGAFLATRTLLIAAALFSIGKGLDYEEATACLTVAALLQWTRSAFYRRTALTGQPVGAGWVASVAAVIALTVWAGFFAYRHVDYSENLWWKFALHSDAPRFLRATLGVIVMLAGACVWRLMSPTAAAARSALSPVDSATIRRILAQANRTDTMLALTGDKRFLLSDAGDAFVMYQVHGASWIVMGDPVGPREAWGELLWNLRDLADRDQGRLLLYQISSPVLDIAIGMGLSIVKYGEDAVVDLTTFTLDTPRLRALRKSERAVARKGARMHIVAASELATILPELESVSDEWLEAKAQREKGFSLGHFDRDYLSFFDMAVVTIDDRIVAFANLWLTENHKEASVDLMRHRSDTPPGTMDFLLVNLMLWAQQQGYARFSLGMAPLSGIEDRRLAPAWAKAAAFIFRHGERFYGFRGLRTYKEKFAPGWEPRYIAGPGGIGLLRGLRDLSRLIARPQPALYLPPAPAAERPATEPKVSQP
ncbi:bifunctional lysylphosphatidylglycerol flippase/synthetase MprF [uncultured Sphingomonas sp.]|uniref:bifunctional lysylphosphatidylglycerol flippase/synthetase MprF n=1 Tax=uncultured Sphingomonas sp. TaxID=158754 RepID=UPI002586F689|nr:bifunctional lysylphosphatidylglycerol flippase/synthetase MprF [uncultured Sphingomonas sp.]